MTAREARPHEAAQPGVLMGLGLPSGHFCFSQPWGQEPGDPWVGPGLQDVPSSPPVPPLGPGHPSSGPCGMSRRQKAACNDCPHRPPRSQAQQSSPQQRPRAIQSAPTCRGASIRRWHPRPRSYAQTLQLCYESLALRFCLIGHLRYLTTIVQVCCFISGFLSGSRRDKTQGSSYEEAVKLRCRRLDLQVYLAGTTSVLHTPQSLHLEYSRCSTNIAE